MFDTLIGWKKSLNARFESQDFEICYICRYLHRTTLNTDPLSCLFAKDCLFSGLEYLGGTVLTAGLTGSVHRVFVLCLVQVLLLGQLGTCRSVQWSHRQPAIGSDFSLNLVHILKGSTSFSIWAKRLHICSTEVILCMKNGAAGHSIQSICNSEEPVEWLEVTAPH